MTETNQTQVLSEQDLQSFFSDSSEEQEVDVALEELLNKEIPADIKTAEKEKIEPKKEEKGVFEFPETSLYKSRIKEYIEDGDWADFAIEQENDKGEKVAVNISDLKDVTPELFKQLKAEQKQIAKEELEKKYISIDGLDDNTKKLIDLKRAGGDLRELIQMDVDFVNPLKDADLDDERVQEYIVRQKLKTNPDLDEDDIDNKIAKLKANFQLDTSAKNIAKEVNENFGKQIDAKKAEFAEKNAKTQEIRKVFKETLTGEFKTLGIADSRLKTIIDLTAKFDTNGLTEIDKAFFNLKETNPKLFSEAAYLMLFPEEYKKSNGIKARSTEAKNTLVRVLNQATKTTKSGTEGIENLESYFEGK